MMYTTYIKRYQDNTNSEFGIQIGNKKTSLIRVTVSLCGKKHTWEWVSTGRKIDEQVRQYLLEHYPICEFPELMWRSEKNRQARGQQ